MKKGGKINRKALREKNRGQHCRGMERQCSQKEGLDLVWTFGTPQ